MVGQVLTARLRLRRHHGQKMRDGRDELASLSDVVFGESSVFQSVFEVFESKAVVASLLVGRGNGRWLCPLSEGAARALFSEGAGEKEVEDVKIPLSRGGRRSPVPLQVVVQ